MLIEITSQNHADNLPIQSKHVSTLGINIAAVIGRSILPYNEMVANAGPILAVAVYQCSMVGVYLLRCVIHIDASMVDNYVPDIAERSSAVLPV